MMRNRLLLGLVLLSFSGCSIFRSRVSLEHFNMVSISDGVDERESRILATKYMLTTQEPVCSAAAKQVYVYHPYIRGGMGNGDIVGFEWKWFRFWKLPIYVRVDKQSGDVECLGQRLFK